MTAAVPDHVRTRLWRDGRLVAENYPLAEVSEHLQDEGALVWVDLHDPTHRELSDVADELDFDPHAVEDVVAHAERTKVTRYATHTFMTIYATSLANESEPADAHGSRLRITRVSVFVVPRGLVTVHRGTGLDVGEVMRRWDDNSDLLRHGTAALLHGLLDVVVDGQFETIQGLDDAIEELEDGLFDERAHIRALQRHTYRVRKELVQLRRVVLPMREVVAAVMRHRAERGNSVELDGWYTDLYDHVIRATEWTESLRDMVTTVFETNLSLQDARLNMVMRKLTGWAAIIAVPTAVTGWYGQNVPYPGFGQWSGVLSSTAIIAGSAGMLYIVFKQRNWL
ncbi:magnesium and cobalt transport protein CorA [Rhodococcus aetherivorans]|uniref:Magnesium and cobalt transport protein CorA n=1 Tax=Rhodococcus aetherivorans TaxID=191292 RepID=A0ABQ0YTK2_9NOCA|nr:magnesium transporter CorA family protein [Rhodococcus aetherivorans]ETT25518.1 Mg2 transporter protein CorA family protein [Rhodococcus rhodochrous ATCC 21198]KDE15361.1 magnesium transporter [Rhodococcus aetherivorans]MDV6292702.1 magnesium transporter CorA family protein [Rhodococcus aetherivorans]NGP24700.1 magnesium transporter CorA family protein [Rhodococcus aetherivorans]UGQ39943.1 magnesium transporter CorA family protein [Rhodococcus aetherivorans]